MLENRTCVWRWARSSGLPFAGSGLVLQWLLRSGGRDGVRGGRTCGGTRPACVAPLLQWAASR